MSSANLARTRLTELQTQREADVIERMHGGASLLVTVIGQWRTSDRPCAANLADAGNLIEGLRRSLADLRNAQGAGNA